MIRTSRSLAVDPRKTRSRRNGYLLVGAFSAGMSLFAAWVRLVLALVPWHNAGIDTPELPSYELLVSQNGRDPAPSSGLRVSADGSLSLLIRPRSPSLGPVSIVAYVGHDGQAGRSRLQFKRFSAGTFALSARVGDLPGLLPGRREITLLVGRPWDLPEEPGLSTAERAADGRLRVLSLRLDVLPVP